MLKVHFLVALRSLLKNKFFSILNISGLAVGIGCVLMIYLYVNHELSYDQHVPAAERIYRANVKGKFGGSDIHISVTNASLAPTLLTDYPEVESFCRFKEHGGEEIIKFGENSYKQKEVAFVDGNYFDFWGTTLIQGDPKTALVNPQSMVITREVAKKIFGEQDPMDKYVMVAGQYEYKITGVMEDLPDNSHFQLSVLMSVSSLPDVKDLTWLNMNYFTYIKLKPGTTGADLDAKFPAMVEKYIGPEIQSIMGISLEDFKKSGNAIGYYLTPLLDIHLKNTSEGDFGKQGDIKYIYIFAAIGLFILTLACINFMNLSTARSANRAKEVGIKKVMGAHRAHLISQFISESTLIALISLIGGIALVYATFQVFNEISGITLKPDALYTTGTLLMMIALVLVIGFAAGSYPAFFLSRFNPVKVLKGKLAQGMKGSSLRSALVTFQFAISIFLIIGTIVVYQQLQFLQDKKLGFDKDQILVLENTYLLRNSRETFRDELLKNTAFEEGTISSFTPSPKTENWVTAFSAGKTLAQNNTSTMHLFQVDEHFLPTYGLEISEGRNFDRNLSTDTAAVILNEAAIKRFGFHENPIGQYICRARNPEQTDVFRVIGVVKDFHFQNLKSAILPLVITYADSYSRMSFRVKPQEFNGALEEMKAKWDEFAPGQPFEYTLLDQTLQAQYEAEQRISQLFKAFTALTIFVACLGLFGLASFTTEQRAKEIGIRKVLGASVAGIVMLISKDFLKLVILSFIISAPLAYYFMTTWLQDFEYRINLSIWIFVASGVLSVLIAWLTLSYQSIAAAIVNPSKSLRSE